MIPGWMQGQQTPEQRTLSYANQLFQDGMYDIAIEQYQQYLDAYPQSPRRAEVALKIGRAYYNLAEYDLALQALVKVDIDYPDTRQARDAQWLIGEIYESMGKWEQAARAFQRLYNYYPQSERAAEGLLRGAQDALEVHNRDLATTLLNTVVEHYYDTEHAVEARLRLAAIYQQQAKYPLAWNELDKALNASPTESQRGRILLARARTAEKLWGNDRAESIYTRLQKDFNGKPIADQATLELGDLAALRGDYSEADHLYSQAEKTSVQHIQTQAITHHGDLAWTQQDFQTARKYYNQALNLYPDPARADTLWLKYALAMEQADMLKPAYVQFSELVKPGRTNIAPSVRRMAYDHLAVTARSLEHYPEAVAALRHLAGLTDGSQRAAVYQRMGDIYAENLHDYFQARRAYTTVTDSFPDYRAGDRVAFSLGKAFLAAGEYQEAERQFRGLLDQYPLTDLRGQTEDQLWIIRHFHSGNQQMSFQRLATLFGDLLLNRDRQELFFELGKLYFQYQQNYASAIEQFQTMSTEQMAPALQDSVNWYLAESNRILARRAGISGDPEAAQPYQDQAVTYYTRVINAGDLSPAIQAEATFHLGTLAADRDQSQAEKYFTALQKNPAYAVRAALRLAEISRSNGQLSRALTELQKIILNYDYTNDPDYQAALALAASVAAADDQPDLTSQYYSRYLQVAPRGPAAAEANWMLMRNAIAASEYDQARQYAEQIQSGAYYTHYAAQVDQQLGQIYIRSEQYDTAARWFENLTRQADPEQSLFLGADTEKNTDAIYWAGFALGHTGKQAEAVQYYRRYVREGTDNDRLTEAYQFLADYAAGQTKYDEARQLYQQAATFAGDAAQSTDLRVQAANMLFERGDYGSAADELKSLSRDLSGQARDDLWEKAVIAYVRSGDLRKAQSEMNGLRKAAKYNDDDLPVLRFQYEQSRVLAANKRLDDSQKILKAILSHKNLPAEFQTEVQYEMARQMVVTNQYEDAMDLLTSLTVDHPDSPVIAQVYITLGTVLADLNQPGKAIQAFRSSLDKGAAGKYRQNAMNSLMKLYQDAGLWDSAISMAKQYIQDFPDAEDAFATKILVGTFLTNMGEYNRAIDYFEGLLQEADSESAAEIQYYIGDAYYKQNKFKQAITEYLKVPYLNPRTKLDWSTNALWYAGQAYERLGDNDRAISLYQRIIDDKGATSNYGRFARKRIDELTSRTPQQ